jgi:DNA-binding NarL/FixJ family response regulator
MAEDHALVREGIRKVLEQHAAIDVVGEASDGEEAVQLTTALRPDVVLMDISMPHLNGIEATRQIKESCPETAVLVLTAYDDDRYVFALLEAGAAGYLLKSAHGDDLVSAVREVHAGESILSPSVARKVLAKFIGPEETREAAPSEKLTEREVEILRLAAAGLPNKAIAADRSLSPRTVQLHLAHIFQKLGVASRTEAVVTGLKRGWLDLEEIE